jgi:CspA family cold shock protein
MTVEGVVREWHDDEGWGVVDSGATPGGCWVHVSAVRARSLRLDVGATVELTYEEAPQTPYSFRAVEAWPAGEEPYRGHIVEVQGPSPAYRSELRLSFGED